MTDGATWVLTRPPSRTVGDGEAELLPSWFEWVEAVALGPRRCWRASAGCEGL